MNTGVGAVGVGAVANPTAAAGQKNEMDEMQDKLDQLKNL